MGLLYICRKVVRKIIDKTFFFWQAIGFHITPVHFYEPIPDTRKLKKELWEENSKLVGVDLREAGQISLINSFVKDYAKDYDSFDKDAVAGKVEYYLENTEFGPLDAGILRCMIRWLKPQKIIEIGSGYSTLLMAKAILKNKEISGDNCELISIDPYPKDFVEKGITGLTKLIKKEVQEIQLGEFDRLGENDILFIDSSHVLKIGSDVQYEYLEILPRLNKGVVVHIHDIFLPAEYPRKWVINEHRFFNEQYLLQAFLQFNNTFEVLWASNYMYLNHNELFKNAFGSNINSGGSFWIKRI